MVPIVTSTIAVSVNEPNGLHTRGDEVCDLRLVLIRLFGDQRLDIFVAGERGARFAADNLVFRGRVEDIVLATDQDGRLGLGDLEMVGAVF